MSIDLTAIYEALESGTCRLPILPASAQAFLGGSLLNETLRPQLWVTDSFAAIEQLVDSWKTIHPGQNVSVLPPRDTGDMEQEGRRLKTLQNIRNPEENTKPFSIITHIRCLNEKIPETETSITLKPGITVPVDLLFEKLEQQGYTLDVEVYEKGMAARRGGILDVWPPTSDHPVRVEFYGDEIDSLRKFDRITQRSINKTESVEIPALNAEGEVLLKDLLPKNTLHFFQTGTNAPHTPHSIETGCVTTDTVNIDLTSYETNLKPVAGKYSSSVAEHQRHLFFQTLIQMACVEWDIDIYMETDGAAARLREAYLSNTGHQKSKIKIRTGLLHGSFVQRKARHLVITEADIYGYTAKTEHTRKKEHAPVSYGERVAEWNDIQPGELVVHVDHGIGKYMGVMEVNMAGRRQEMLLIEYANHARIYLPTGQAHLLTRYVGMGNVTPALHTLKGKRWQNDRASAETAIEDLAARMLETQAARELRKGQPCGPDTHWQSEFENSFPYMETPDQLAAATAVKADLESPRPADRLICGDAGYGKTEVAMRAAFKIVMDGRQVAVLVPTTILAQQHFDTFTERMAAFPINIEMLSRFRTPTEQKAAIERLKHGESHIVIGTHRITSKDVNFKDLGLVIIDEEQRFGVRTKEHLKQLRNEVDVLTLSATPIPRTLYLGLTGARDMSTITTPPHERQPVETFVLETHDDIIRESIEHELARDGQVFCLHNRIQTIEKFSAHIQKLVPDAQVEFAHGQMSEKELADIMHRFVRGQFDVLVCTTIIENGVDIPNCNTILVDRADRFGLADLYQLRGRVGRSRRKAYAFLLIPPNGVLSDEARQRIEALKKHTGHGTGLRIAMRDLEIRGAGNLLGAQQSGHIAAIGFDLYCQLLKRSVARLQGKKVPPLINTVVDLDFIERSPASGNEKAGAYIPYRYIDDENLRIKLYGRIASLTKESEVRELKKEFTDRFGKLSAPVRNLFEIARIRIAAASVAIETVRTNEERILLIRNNDTIMVEGRYPRLSERTASRRLKEILTLIKKLKS